MTMGTIIATYRKQHFITQEALAQKLGVSNQAVSKWEADQCCPDIALLPQIADIFGITIDQLFGREPKQQTIHSSLPWPDTDALHMVLYQGHKLLSSCPADKCSKLMFTYEGPALDVISAVSVTCKDVQGDVNAGGNVDCGSVGGDVDAGSSVDCGSVGGDVDAGAYVNCGNVDGDVDAGGNVSCGDVSGDVDAGGNVSCRHVDGDVDAGCNVYIQNK